MLPGCALAFVMWAEMDEAYRCHWNACMGLFSLTSTLPRLNPFCCFRKAASRVPYETRTCRHLTSARVQAQLYFEHTHDIKLLQLLGLCPPASVPETDLSHRRSTRIPSPPHTLLTVNPSACVSISCFHCISATTGATTRLGFRRGSDRSRAIVWML